MSETETLTDESIIDTDKLLTPFTGDNPAGELANYETEYEEIELEISKLSSIEMEIVDWELVSTNSQHLLVNKSKDLHLSCFLSASLLELHGFKGLNEGLQLVDQLQNSFWHDLYPPLKRMRGRAGAISWLSTQLIKLLPTHTPNQTDAEPLEEIYATLESIDQFSASNIDQNTPNLAELLRLINGYRSDLQTTTQPQPVQPAVAAAPTATQAASENQTASKADASPSDTPKADPSDLSKTLQSARNCLKTMTNSIRKSELHNPNHFYTNRVDMWLPVTELPLNKDGVTQLQPPTPELITRIKTLIENGETEPAILAIEEALPSSPFWFEGNRLCANALAESGAKFGRARLAVISTTLAFIQRQPGLAELTFADGSEFISDGFSSWLASETGSTDGHGSTTSTSTARPEIEAKTETEVRKLADQGKLAEALNLLEQEIQSAASGKLKYTLRLLQAELCSNNERYDMAAPILERLDDEQQQREMFSWEPDLSIQVLQSLLNCYTKIIQKKPADADKLQSRTESVFQRLCQLEPAAAFKYKL